MRPASLLVALSLTASPGCYLLHGFDGTPGSTVDAGSPRGDAGTPPGFDAGEPSRPDAGARDAGPPLPREPEPDPGPGGRPSDDDDDWIEPPDLGEDDPCCVLGDPVRVTSRDEGMSLLHEPPLIAWGPGRWAIAVARVFARTEGMVNRLVVFDLAADGSRIGEARVLDLPPFEPEAVPLPQALRWAAGRWALAITSDRTMLMRVRLFDGAFVAASPWLPIGPGTAADVAYVAHGDQWLGFTSGEDAIRSTPFDELAGVRAAVDTRAPPTNTLSAASFGSRAAIAPLVFTDGVGPADLVVVDPTGAELGRVPLGSRRAQDGAMAALRDFAIVAFVRDHRVEVEVYDPFALRSVAGPRDIGAAGPEMGEAYHHDAIDVVGSNKFGLAGVCWGVPGGEPGSREDSHVLFRLVGPDGRPRGAATTVVSSSFRGSMTNCRVGSDDHGFLVGWWDGSELWVRRVDVVE
ncbi:MAG: hypothetical protein KF729_20980 [Sandaracinaceae bacterium]|nr:hypothetical protein [Sandaracinaceae bacterium]